MVKPTNCRFSQFTEPLLFPPSFTYIALFFLLFYFSFIIYLFIQSSLSSVLCPWFETTNHMCDFIIMAYRATKTCPANHTYKSDHSFQLRWTSVRGGNCCLSVDKWLDKITYLCNYTCAL